jgi:hypothetical protein
MVKAVPGQPCSQPTLYSLNLDSANVILPALGHLTVSRRTLAPPAQVQVVSGMWRARFFLASFVRMTNTKIAGQ